MANIKIKLMDIEKDWQAHYSFISDTYSKGKDYILNNKKFFKWFFKNPFSSPPSCMHVVKKNGEIISEHGFVPNRFKLFDKIIKSQCVVNCMARKEYRGKGTGFVLCKCSEENTDLSINLGYNLNGKIILQRLKWKEMPYLKRFVKILNLKKIEKLTKSSGFDLGKENEIKIKNDLIFEKRETIDEDIILFWNKIKGKYPITVERSKKYLDWRYVNHPLLKYHIFITKRGNEIQSFIILRIEKTENYKIGRIIDFISMDNTEEFTLFRLIELCQKQGVDLIDFFFTGNFHAKTLKKLGFVEAKKRPYTLIPVLLNPIDRTKKYINFAFKLISKDLYDKRINNINNWYLTKGDSDRDRPN